MGSASMSLEIVCWFAMMVGIIGTVFNIKKQWVCFVLWAASNSVFTTYNILKAQYHQGIIVALNAVLAVWGIWEWRLKKRKENNATGRIP